MCLRFPCHGTSLTARSTSSIRRRTPETPGRASLWRVRIRESKAPRWRFLPACTFEIRGAVLRRFLDNRVSIGASFLLASGYAGQTRETLALATDPVPFERVVGVPLKSYVSLNWTYYFLLQEMNRWR